MEDNMKVYLIAHEGKPYWWKMCSWVDSEKVGKNGIHIKSIRAFLKKKDAKDWIKKTGWDHLVIKTAELL